MVVADGTPGLLGRPHATRHRHLIRLRYIRRGMSIWTRVEPVAEQRAVRSLRDDLTSGRWAKSNRDVVDLNAAELGVRLLIA